MAGAPVSVTLDAQGTQSVIAPERGIARYVREHVDGLVAVAPERIHSVSLNPDLPLPLALEHLVGSGLLRWGNRVRRGSGTRPGIYHVMSPFELGRPLEEIWPTWARRGDVRTVVTLYDLIPLVFHETYLSDPRVRSRYTARLNLLRTADQLVALSETSKRDAVERLGVDPTRITVIGGGVSNRLATLCESRDDGLARIREVLPQIRPGFVLYVAGIDFRKNLERAYAAYGRLDPRLRSAHQLVIACRAGDEHRGYLDRLARDTGVAPDDVVVTDLVTDEQLASLYRSCELFFFPSLYEGFGLPIVEAMSCGAPVVASRTLARDLLGTADGSFDPHDTAEMAACLERALAGPEGREGLRALSSERVGRFTWEEVARRTLTAYDAALERRRRTARRAKPRIALVTPWPREASGIADYNRRLVPELLRFAEVDVIVSGEEDNGYEHVKRPGSRLIAAGQHRLSRQLRSYDRIVYCLGNSPLHRHVYRALLDAPGIVVAHDARLTALYWLIGHYDHPDEPDWYLSKLRTLYGSRDIPLHELNGFGESEHEAARRLGIYMTGEIQALAEKVVVHSRHSAEVMRLEAPSDAPEIALTPFGVPPRVPRARHDRRGPLVASVGVLHQIKGIETLLHAFRSFAAGRVGARLVLVGQGRREEVAHWRRRARELAPGENVEVTGWVPQHRYWNLLASADAAVQLRRFSNGEASASVCDCIAAGVPTIVSDLAWYSELPDDTVVRVPADCTPLALTRALNEVVDDDDLGERLEEGQRRFGEQNSFARVAESYAECLEL